MGDLDDDAFAKQCEALRARLRAHCYRMCGSVDDAEDLVQETFARAWRSRERFEGRAQLSTWLHRIATNVCLDALEQRPARVLPEDVVRAVAPDDEPRATPPLRPELPWLQPYPDRLLDPEEMTSSRQSIELAFLAALQHLPPRQRALLILCDVVGWTAKEAAAELEMTVPAVTSALQRAHAAMHDLVPSGRTAWTPRTAPTAAERELLSRYMAAWERDAPDELIRLLRDDVKWSMPPAALWFVGKPMIEVLFRSFPMRFHGEHRLVAAGANGQLAAVAYMKPHGGSEYRFGGVHVLRVEAGQVAEITSFGAPLCRGFEVPMIFPAAGV